MTALNLTQSALHAPTLAQFGGAGMFAGFFLFGILVLIVLAVGGIASVVGLIYIWVRALKQPSYAQGLANCGRCGYGVRGSATMTCPECGADFREVGILSPLMRKTFISPALFIVLWSLCLWIPGCVVSSIALATGPQETVSYEDYEINLNTNTYEDFTSVGPAPKPFDRAVLEQWIASTGGDLKNADVQQQIDQVYNNIQQAQSAGIVNANWSTFSVNSQNTWADSHPAGWFMVLQPVFWVMVYVAGIVLYFLLKRRYDKTMAQLRDEALATDPYASPPIPQPHNPFDSIAQDGGRPRAGVNHAHNTMPGCGRCGYPTRGITSFECPECGADLREVGIQRPGQGKAAVAGCLLPIGLTVLILIVASILMPVISSQLPTYRQNSFDLRMSPNSGQYNNATILYEADVELSPGKPNYSRGVSTSSSSSASGRTSQITITNPAPPTRITRLEFQATPAASSQTASFTARFQVDPTTQQASWTDSQGKQHATTGPCTDQDVLAFLAALGADPNNADVQREAGEVYAMLDGFAKGMNHYSLQEFGVGGSGSTSLGLGGPSWFGPSYFSFWLVLWIIGLVWLIRRGRSKAAEGPEQN
eukprot:g14108.t1